MGIMIGTYSSVFIASPVLFYGHQRSEAKERDKK